MTDWYIPSSDAAQYVQIGVDWQENVSNTQVTLTPNVYRWDKYDTWNTGGRWSESWDGVTGRSWGGGSGTRLIATLAQKVYARQHQSYTVNLEIAADSSFGSAYGGSFHNIGAWNHTWTYEIPAKPSYTVTYNANGGINPPNSQIKWHDESLKLSNVIPTRENYKFLGWSTSATSTSVIYDTTDNKTVEYTANNNVTLYAVWKLNNYTITYHSGYNDAVDGILSQSYIYGDQISLETTPKITPENWTFIGWSESRTGLEINYEGGYTTTNFGNKDLYAIFQRTITGYNGENQNNITVVYNQTEVKTSHILPAIAIKDENWTAIGWATSSEVYDFTETKLITTQTTEGIIYDLGPNWNELYTFYKRTNINIYNGNNTPMPTIRYCCCYYNKNIYEWKYSNLPPQNIINGWTPIGWSTNHILIYYDENTKSNVIDSSTVEIELTDNNNFYGIYTRPIKFYYLASGAVNEKQYFNSSGQYALEIPMAFVDDKYQNLGWSLVNIEGSPCWTTNPNKLDEVNTNNDWYNSSSIQEDSFEGKYSFYQVWKRTFTIRYNPGEYSNTKSPTINKIDSSIEEYQSFTQYYNTSNKITDLTNKNLLSDIYTREGYNKNTGWYLEDGSQRQTLLQLDCSMDHTNEILLYPQWTLIQPNPSITQLFSWRVTEDGVMNEEGTCVYIEFLYSQPNAVENMNNTKINNDNFSIEVSPIELSDTISYIEGINGSISLAKKQVDSVKNNSTKYIAILKLNNSDSFNTETQYKIKISATTHSIEQGLPIDKSVKVSVETIITKSFFTMDFLAGGTGIAIGSPSSSSGFINAMETSIFKGLAVYPNNYRNEKIASAGRNLVIGEGTVNNDNSIKYNISNYISTLTSNTPVSINFNINSQITNDIFMYFIDSNGVQMTDTITINSSSDNHFIYRNIQLSNGNSWSNVKYLYFSKDINISNLKIEEGPSASSWTPAPEESALLLIDSVNGIIINDAINISGNIAPKQNNLFNLGSDINKWQNIYATNIYGTLTGNVTGILNGSIQDKSDSNKMITFSSNELSLLNCEYLVGWKTDGDIYELNPVDKRQLLQITTGTSAPDDSTPGLLYIQNQGANLPLIYINY